MSSQDMLFALLNTDNPQTVPFSASNVSLSNPTPASVGVENTQVALTPLPGSPYSGNTVVYYHRIDLIELGTSIVLASPTQMSAADIVAKLNALNDKALLGTEDFNTITVPPMNPGDSIPLNLVANPNSYRWVGTLAVTLNNNGVVSEDWIKPSYAIYDVSPGVGGTPETTNQLVYGSQLWRDGTDGKIEIVNAADGTDIAVIDIAALLGSTSPPIFTHTLFDSPWAVDTTRNHLWIRCSASAAVGVPYIAVIDMATKALVFSLVVSAGQGVGSSSGYLHYDPVSDLMWYEHDEVIEGLNPTTGVVMSTITSANWNAVAIDTDKGELWLFTSTFSSPSVNQISIYNTRTAALVRTLAVGDTPASALFDLYNRPLLAYFPEVKEIGMMWSVGDAPIATQTTIQTTFDTFSTATYTRIAPSYVVSPEDSSIYTGATTLGKPHYKADTNEFVFFDYTGINTKSGMVRYLDRATKTHVRKIFSPETTNLYQLYGGSICLGPTGALYADVVYPYVNNSKGTHRYTLKLSPASQLSDTSMPGAPVPLPVVPPVTTPVDWDVLSYPADNILIVGSEIWSATSQYSQREGRGRSGLIQVTREGDGGFSQFFNAGALVGYVGATDEQIVPNGNTVMFPHPNGVDTVRNHLWTECATQDGHHIGVFDLATKALVHSFATYSPPTTFGPASDQWAKYDALHDKVWFLHHDETTGLYMLRSFDAGTYTQIDSFDSKSTGSFALDSDKGEFWTLSGSDGFVYVFSNAGVLLHTLGQQAGSGFDLVYIPGANLIAVHNSDSVTNFEGIDFWSTTTYTKVGRWVAPALNQFVYWNDNTAYMSGTHEFIVGTINNDTGGQCKLITIDVNTFTTKRILFDGTATKETPSSVRYQGGNLYFSTSKEWGAADNALGTIYAMHKISAATLAAI